MGERTGISWTDHTFNAWWGCHRLSPACANCYAADWAGRFGWEWGKDAPRRFFGAGHWREPEKWNRKAKEAGVPAFVFCSSMADVWEEREYGRLRIPDDQWTQMQDARARLWDLVEVCDWLVFLLLSKRPGLAPEFVPRAWMTGSWPRNAWAGATMENQREADARWEGLSALPAPRLFASIEPAQEAVDLSTMLSWRFKTSGWNGPESYTTLPPKGGRGLDWAIYGGESGDNARPSDVDWGRRVIRQCRAAGASPFFKQTGVRSYDSAAPGGETAQDRAAALVIPANTKRARLVTGDEVRLLSNAHGSALEDFPEDCRVQERPEPLPVVSL